MMMTKLERRARRALAMADRFRREGDEDGVSMCMARWRDISRRIARHIDDAFASKLSALEGLRGVLA